MFKKYNKKLCEYLLIFLLSVLLITIFSKCSPLYKYNDIPDCNIWLDHGKNILRGKILYKDLYEHKGPLQLIPFIFAAMFKNSFLFIYVVEIICLFITLIFVYKIAELYKIYPLATTLLTSFVITYNVGFCDSSTTEELFLFVFPVVIYIVLKAIKLDKMLSFKEAVIIGILNSFLLWSKYSLCCFTIGLCIFMVIWHLYKKKGIGMQIIGFLLGVMIVTTPILIYFYLNDALPDLFKVYFYNVIFVYSKNWKFKIPVGLYTNFIFLINVGFLIITALFVVLYNKKIIKIFKRLDTVFIVTIFVIMVAFYLYMQIYQTYYYLPFTVLSVFPIMGILNYNGFIKYGALTVCLGFILLYNNTNAEFLFNDNQYDQFKIFEYINSSGEDKNILCLCPESGFYYNTNNVPQTKYFTETFNISTPEIINEKERLIKNREFDFIISDEPKDYEGYKFVMYVESTIYDTFLKNYKSKNFEYYLYERI